MGDNSGNFILRTIIRRAIQRFGRQNVSRFLKLSGTVAFLSTAVSMLTDGTDIVTKKVPLISRFVARHVLLSKNFKKTLALHILRNEFNYTNACLMSVEKADLDESGDYEFLLLTIYRKARNKLTNCDTGQSLEGGQETLILKEAGWSGLWPSYDLLLQDDGQGYPMSFHTNGPFLIGQPYGVDFVGYSVYGYHAGILHHYDSPWGFGGKTATPLELGESRIQNHLYMKLEKGLTRFDIGTDDTFSMKVLTTNEVHEINSATISLTDGTAFGAEKDFITTSGGERLRINPDAGGDCPHQVFVDGNEVVFDDDPKHEICATTVPAKETSVVVTSIPCDVEGFILSKQFPWGYVPDLASNIHVISCPETDEDSSHSYQIKFSLEE